MAFLQRMLAVVAQHVPTDVEEVWAMFATLLDPENKVYKLYGQTCVPPPPPPLLPLSTECGGRSLGVLLASINTQVKPFGSGGVGDARSERGSVGPGIGGW